MKRKLAWCVAGVLILGLALLAVSCGGTTPSTEEPSAPPTKTEEPKVETPVTPMAIPHSLEGRADCLLCHGEGAAKPFPADHAGRTSDTCTGCH